jgi:hypothetical protein
VGVDHRTVAAYARVAKQVRRQHDLRAGRQLGGGFQGFLQRVTAHDGSSLVLKVGASDREIRAHAHAFQHGAPVPALIACQQPTAQGPGWMIMAYVDAAPVTFVEDPYVPSPLLGQAQAMAEALQRLHACPVLEDLDSSADWYAERLQRATSLARALGEKVPETGLQDVLSRCAAQRSILIHGDCSWRNVQRIRGSDRYVLFDVSGFVGPVASDVAEWVVSASQWPPHVSDLVDEVLRLDLTVESDLLPWLTVAVGSRVVEEVGRSGGRHHIQWARMFAEAVRLGDIRETFGYNLTPQLAVQMHQVDAQP